MESEILRVLKEILTKVTSMADEIKKNSELITENQNAIKELVKKPLGGGPVSPRVNELEARFSTLMEQTQKQMQVMELNRVLQDVRELMTQVAIAPVPHPAVTSSPKTVQGVTTKEEPLAAPIPTIGSEGVPVSQGSVSPQEELDSLQTSGKKDKTNDTLLKPSDLFG